ncbi:UxaA family hydrolase [Chitinophaga sp. MM2321]|uniref:UxaA family hydrolase n=1 Tax=Chitinophaga sp. MM2321 TaxID=3137178 RepID=UPI0032D59404
MEKLIKINPEDNVYVVRNSIQAGEQIALDGLTITFNEPLGIGHKVAAVHLAKGDKIIKFGVPIGSATTDIACGMHVHLHNMKSDYIPTYTLDHEFIKDK